MIKKIFPILVALTVLITGCATIVNSKTQLVSFQSTPSGATVLIDGRPMGQTPLSIQLERKSGQALLVHKEGYKDFSTTLGTNVSGWFFGNIIIGGLLGSTTDAATGAMHEYSPNQFLVTLEADATNAATSKTEKTKADKVREFILLSYSMLATDIKAGSGNYLNGLLTQLEIKDDKRENTINQLKGLLLAYPDVTKFVDHVIDDFVK